MRDELKTYTLNLKSLNQYIETPIIAGAGDINGHTFRIIFTQEAAKQFSDTMKVYLNWHHLDADVYGYNVFTCTKTKPYTWEIHWPAAMLAHKGDVLARIELRDSISISPSNNFTIKILSNPNDDSYFADKDDYSIFSQACLDLTAVQEDAEKQLTEQKEEWNKIIQEWAEIKDHIHHTLGEVPEDMTMREYIDTQDDSIYDMMTEYIDEKLNPQEGE